ncbi:Aristolochene synthase from penicillium Roqueforti [Annulohypoxylon truncatum]|uniref:Aristolochene synthase from penicillium Roqueforti n=1 Tax=Annulohypoxylon truncatum TaxID=327061 RepID=UPI00200853F7|nr:Aristolochene synthase from penicillium Roqueforti [Annulohypoxylon truncatum]KAI1208436.1 Aristolochene synthase from penicillium Roqueforti [Annulohypoxylon truncatum]
MAAISQLYEIPASTFVPICHPLYTEVSTSVNQWFLENWDFPNEDARKKFVRAGFSHATCSYFPKSLDDRIGLACKLLSILFLIDDQLEHLSLSDGAAYNEHLMPLCKGEALPNHNSPVEWMMYSIWEEMRQCNESLANGVLEPVFTFMRAQTSPERLTVKELGPYLRYRQGDVGQALLAALMRFCMGLYLDNDELDSVREIELNVGRHISIVNDIFSFEKELASSKVTHEEGGVLCSAVSVLAGEINIGTSAAKRILWSMCREWELIHQELVKKRMSSEEACSSSLQKYVKALEYQMSGNELWSRSTGRYGTQMNSP